VPRRDAASNVQNARRCPGAVGVGRNSQRRRVADLAHDGLFNVETAWAARTLAKLWQVVRPARHVRGAECPASARTLVTATALPHHTPASRQGDRASLSNRSRSHATTARMTPPLMSAPRPVGRQLQGLHDADDRGPPSAEPDLTPPPTSVMPRLSAATDLSQVRVDARGPAVEAVGAEALVVVLQQPQRERQAVGFLDLEADSRRLSPLRHRGRHRA
jgi:hypothetical protein